MSELKLTDKNQLDDIFGIGGVTADQSLATIPQTDQQLAVRVEPVSQEEIDTRLTELLGKSNNILDKAQQIMECAVEEDTIAGAASLVNSVTGIISELNKSVILKKKFEYQMELEKLKIEAKLKLQEMKNQAKAVTVKGDNTTVNQTTVVFKPEDVLRAIRENQKIPNNLDIEVN